MKTQFSLIALLAVNGLAWAAPSSGTSPTQTPIRNGSFRGVVNKITWKNDSAQFLATTVKICEFQGDLPIYDSRLNHSPSITGYTSCQATLDSGRKIVVSLNAVGVLSSEDPLPGASFSTGPIDSRSFSVGYSVMDANNSPITDIQNISAWSTTTLKDLTSPQELILSGGGLASWDPTAPRPDTLESFQATFDLIDSGK